MTEIVLLTTTVDSKEQAARIAETVVRERLAACAQLQGPIESWYWWQGEVANSLEWYCHFKAPKPLAERLRLRVVQLHPYEVPEVIVIPVVDGHHPYFEWVATETKPNSTEA